MSTTTVIVCNEEIAGIGRRAGEEFDLLDDDVSGLGEIVAVGFGSTPIIDP